MKSSYELAATKVSCCLLLTLLGLASQLPAQTSLSDDPQLTDYYTTRELEELTVLVNFFDNYVTQQTGEDDLQKAYVSFNKQQAAARLISLDILLDTVRAMFGRVNLPVWNSIWEYGSIGTYRSRDSLQMIVPMIDLNLHGAYWKFLLALANTDEQIARYTKAIQLSGSLSPTLQGLYFNQYHDYPVNFTPAANRLVAAVHYLTFHVQAAEHPE